MSVWLRSLLPERSATQTVWTSQITVCITNCEHDASCTIHCAPEPKPVGIYYGYLK